jgi:alkylation response protein AidB-like acyl-CoA dehydrogenase
MPRSGPVSEVEAQALIARAEAFAENVVARGAPQWEHDRQWPGEALAAAAALGLNRIQVPAEQGGYDLPYTVKMRIVEVFARHDMAFAFAWVNAHNATARLARDGTPAQRERWLPGLLAGTSVGTVCLTEPGAGSDFPAITTRARRNGDGWVLDGAKAWATNAAGADHAVVYAQTDPSAGYKGIAGFLVDLHAPGVTDRHVEPLVGGHAIGAGGFRLEGVELDADALFYPPGEAFKRALASINGARTYVAAMCNAMLDAALRLAVAGAMERHTFGSPLSERQGIRWMLADAATDLEASRLLTERAARLIDAGEDAIEAAAHAKKFAVRIAERRLRDCMQVLGARGLRESCPIGRHLVGARIANYVDGTTEMQNERIAASLLRRLADEAQGKGKAG